MLCFGKEGGRDIWSRAEMVRESGAVSPRPELLICFVHPRVRFVSACHSLMCWIRSVAASRGKKSFLSFLKVDIFAHRGLDDVFCHTWIWERCWVWLFLFPWMLAKRQKTDCQSIPMFGCGSCLKGLSRVLIGHFKPFTVLYFFGLKVKTVIKAKRAKTS